MSNRYILNVVKLIIYLFVILITIQIAALFYKIYAEPISSSHNMYLYNIIEPVLIILCGIALRYEKLYTCIRKAGIWKVALLRLLILAMPITIISFQMALYYSNFILFRVFGELLYSIGIKGSALIIVQLLSGTVIVSCIEKVDPLGSIEIERESR